MCFWHSRKPVCKDDDKDDDTEIKVNIQPFRHASNRLIDIVTVQELKRYRTNQGRHSDFPIDPETCVVLRKVDSNGYNRSENYHMTQRYRYPYAHVVSAALNTLNTRNTTRMVSSDTNPYYYAQRKKMLMI